MRPGRAVTTGPLTEILRREEAGVRVSVLKDALRLLTSREADVLVRLAGIFGHEARSAGVVAKEVGCPVKDVRTLNVEARRKVRDYLTSIGHPSASKATG